jgi:trk system potassium uptake protein TrkA
MKIIIIGNGKVGYTLAQQLSSEKHDLTIIDSTPAALQRADSNLDVLCVTGNGASISVLIDAGVRRTDLVIAVTNYDEVNIMCCLIAKKLGAKHTIARIRTPDYYNDAPLLKRETGLDMIINPELSAAQEISRILRFPNASSIESFARGRVEMIGFRLEKGDSLAGIPLYEFNRLHPNRTLLCAVQRGDEVVIPNGSFVPEFGDTGYIIGSPSELSRIFRELGRPMTKIKDVTVIGGSRITIYLAHALEKMDMHMRIIEIDMAKCQMLSEALPHVLVIQGDGTDNDLLESENALSADAFVTLTGRDEENLLMALNAIHAGVGKVIAKMTRPNYINLVRDTEIDSIISPKDITANQISSYVRAIANSEGSAVERLYKLLGDKLEAVEFTANASTRFLNTALKDLKLRDGLLIASIVRGDDTIIPDGNDMILEGDRVIVVAKSLFLQDLNDILK